MADGSALTVLMEMIEAQGGDLSVFEDMAGFHNPGATCVVEGVETGYIASMDTTMLGWAVQRTGAGRERLESRSILMPGSFSMRGAGRLSRRASHWLRCTRRTRRNAG